MKVLKRLIGVIKYFSRKMKAHKVTAYSAQSAFFMMFSLVPLSLLLLSLMRSLSLGDSSLMFIFSGIMPESVGSFLEQTVNSVIGGNDIAVTSVSVIALLWAASKGVFCIIGGLNSVYERKETRNYVAVRALAVLYTLVFVLILVFVLLLFVFGNRIANSLTQLLPNLTGLMLIFRSVRFVIGLVLLILVFMLLYTALPNGKQRFLSQFCGAVTASLGWLGFSFLFSFFIDNISNYSKIYGSLTAIIVFMLWLYSCMTILFFGAEINLIVSKDTSHVIKKA